MTAKPSPWCVPFFVCLFAFPAWGQPPDPPAAPDDPALLHEPAKMTTALDWAGKRLGSGSDEAEDGLYANVGNMVPGAGWLAIGPGYRMHLFAGRATVDAAAGLSWRGYKTLKTSLELPRLAGNRLAIGSEALWQDLMQVNYFGLGNDSPEALRSQYRMQTLNVVGYARYRPQPWLAVGGRFGWLDGVSVQSAAGPFNRDYLDAQTTFPDDPAMRLEQQPDYLHGDVSVTADTRDHPGHPTRGAVYRSSAAVYADRDLDAFSFRRYEVEGLQVIPLFARTWVVALRGWGVFSDTSAGHVVPFYLTPGLGGSNSLRAYPNYRFHDRHLLLASAESRWPLLQHVDAAVFFDAGSVARRVRDLDLATTSYGVGFRVHTHSATMARLDVAHGREGWQVLFRMNDPLALGRLKRWTAAVPFVP